MTTAATNPFRKLPRKKRMFREFDSSWGDAQTSRTDLIGKLRGGGIRRPAQRRK